MRRFTAPLSEEDIHALAAIFAAGGVVLLPTDTVYGVAARVGEEAALARIIEAKGRDPKKPCQLLAADASVCESLGLVVNDAAARLARVYWPGALTLVLPRRDDPTRTEGVRVPDDDTARAVCRAAGGMLRCTSANHSGEPAAQTADEAAAALPTADALVDGGRVRGGIGSSVVRANDDGTLTIFREGAIPAADLTRTATLSCNS